MGIEPTLSAWKAEVLPLNYTRFSNHQKLESVEVATQFAKFFDRHILLLRILNRVSGNQNGGGRIRTFEGVSRQIYSLIPLAAREPLL